MSPLDPARPIATVAAYALVYAAAFLLLGLLQLGLWLAVFGWPDLVRHAKATHRARMAVVRRATASSSSYPRSNVAAIPAQRRRT